VLRGCVSARDGGGSEGWISWRSVEWAARCDEVKGTDALSLACEVEVEWTYPGLVEPFTLHLLSSLSLVLSPRRPSRLLSDPVEVGICVSSQACTSVAPLRKP